MSLSHTVAQSLRTLRAERKFTQQVVAKKAHLSVAYVSMLERGERNPPLETLEALAKALGVSPLYLFEERSSERARPRHR
jgi:transcriptional regulator with XRE-family HTH domain